MPDITRDQAKALFRGAFQAQSNDLLGFSTGVQNATATGRLASTAYGTPIDPTPYLPIQGRVTQGFGVPQAVRAAGEKTHAGIDIAVPSGTPIPAGIDGVVLDVQDYGTKGYGKTVVVKGADGVIRRYSHLSTFGIKPGQRVKKADVIGLSGSSGASTGPHLDYRTYK